MEKKLDDGAELIEFNPEDLETYPSVCQSKEEVRERLGFTGGETLLFDNRGNYLGQLINVLEGGK